MSRLVSVILPTYNRAYCLPKAIDSVLAQSYQDFEIVLVDDGSTDNTRELVSQRYGRDPRIKYIHGENRGVSSARNTALKAAQGAFLAFLDSDDIWMPWKLEVQLKCLDFLPHAGMIWSDMEAITSDGKVASQRFLRTMYDSWDFFTMEQLFSENHDASKVVPGRPELEGIRLYCGKIFGPMLMGNMVHTSTVVVRREIQQKVGEFDLTLKTAGGDYDFHFRTTREAQVAFLDVPTIQYLIGHGDRLTRLEKVIAQNFLRTIENRLREDRDQINLPEHMIHGVLARAHCWVGTEMLNEGERGPARPHLWKSLRYQPWQPLIAAKLMTSFLPEFVERPLLKGYHWLRGNSATKAGPSEKS